MFSMARPRTSSRFMMLCRRSRSLLLILDNVCHRSSYIPITQNIETICIVCDILLYIQAVDIYSLLSQYLYLLYLSSIVALRRMRRPVSPRPPPLWLWTTLENCRRTSLLSPWNWKQVGVECVAIVNL
jgi:hypothetical protein